MSYAVVGMGVQGAKRRAVLGDLPHLTVDPVAPTVDFRDLRQVPLDAYDAVLLCTPDAPKPELVRYAVDHGKHVLVEKPFTLSASGYAELAQRADASGATVYVAYNHRFEPHIAAAQAILEAGAIGDIYTVWLSYGNGTAELVRASAWRDTGNGVIADLGSHLLDMVDMWWGLGGREIDMIDARRVENRAPDHALMRLSGDWPIYLETTMLSWRNDFRCDIRGSEGSLHISSLCKWGPTSLTIRGRVHPSGRPDERVETLVQADPTWAAEFAHFRGLIEAGNRGNLDTSREISRILTSVDRMLADATEGLTEA
jgi:scyllo-inositol 2-dehydrogenase (NADP+)